MGKVESQSPAGTLVPPQGAVFGSVTESLGSFSQNVGWTDDATIGNQTQAANGNANGQYYVYWVNGVKNPYYVVIQRIVGSFSPGNMIAKGPNSYGFFQAVVSLSSALAAGSNATASMVAHSPGTFVSSQGSADAPVNLDVPMILLLPSGGGWAPQSFDAVEQTAIPLTDWGILDQTQSSTLTLQSSFHQVTGWDPLAHLPSDWPNWYTFIYDNNDNSMSPASFSTGTLQFEAIVAWMLVPSSKSESHHHQDKPPAPPSMPITITTSFSQYLAAWHNIAGCNTVYTGSGQIKTINGAHHISYPHQDFPPFTWSVDLKTMVTP